FVAGFVVAFIVATKYNFFHILELPIAPYLEGRQLIVTHPADPFRLTLSVSIWLGLVLALPVILYQLWAFLAPALYSHEKKVVIPVFIFGTILFLCGIALSYFVILPITLRFLFSIQAASLDMMISAREYFGFAIAMSLAMGAVFELPILIIGLTAVGVVTPRFLQKFRRYAVVLCLVASALITPGADPLSLLALALPLYGLYEVSVIASAVVHRRRTRRARADMEQVPA
ncbi:MAG TPA: twin-arginine translocase subunit TatC, partial [Gemmatimonadaceae bacterium]|nr:twin-arginine translocase subunit TatC [Gemmatimonadaceae bacterium]